MSVDGLSPKLKTLYEEKRFSDLILEIESTTSDENRSAFSESFAEVIVSYLRSYYISDL